MPYVTSIERLAIAKAKDEGKIEGKIEGAREGKVEGKREGLLSGIELSLELKFGAAGRDYFAQMKDVADVELLERILHAIKKAATLDELSRLSG